jgi:hypothetical protein
MVVISKITMHTLRGIGRLRQNLPPGLPEAMKCVRFPPLIQACHGEGRHNMAGMLNALTDPEGNRMRTEKP